MRLRRMMMGLSQEQLGAALGLTFQQVQKYEKGQNRIGASRLYAIARALDAPVAYFFEEMPGGAEAEGAAAAAGKGPALSDLLASPETLELALAFARVADPAARRRLIELVRAMAGDEGAGPD